MDGRGPADDGGPENALLDSRKAGLQRRAAAARHARIRRRIARHQVAEQCSMCAVFKPWRANGTLLTKLRRTNDLREYSAVTCPNDALDWHSRPKLLH